MATKNYGAFSYSQYFSRSYPTNSHPNLYVGSSWNGDDTAKATLTANISVSSMIYDDVAQTVTITVNPWTWTLQRSGNWGYNHDWFTYSLHGPGSTCFYVLLSDGVTKLNSKVLDYTSSGWSIFNNKTQTYVITGVTSKPIKFGFAVNADYESVKSNNYFTAIFYARSVRKYDYDWVDWIELSNAPQIESNIGGVWKLPDTLSVNIGGVWKYVDTAYANVNGVFKNT